MPYISTAKEARDLVKDILVTNQGTLGLGYVGVDDERKLPYYPAVVVSAGPREKELHSTNTFAITIRVFIWVYHADLSVGHATRSDDDLDLADSIESLLEADMTYNNQIIQGWIESQVPGVFQPRAGKGELVIGTRMTWAGLTQQRY